MAVPPHKWSVQKVSVSLECAGGKVKREEPLSVDINVSLSSGQLLLKTNGHEDNLLSGVISGGQSDVFTCTCTDLVY